jgi:hypothetical protein
VTDPKGGAARGLAEAVEGATWRYSARQSVRCLPPPMARTPARKPRVLDRGALLPDRRAAEKFGGVPMVRIHLPPAQSPLRTLVSALIKYVDLLSCGRRQNAGSPPWAAASS